MSINGVGEDRISALPDEIIHKILSVLPMDCAIQTGILSNRWRHLWKFNPVIEFQSLPFSNAEAVDYGLVNRCLSLHKAPKIRKFIIVTRVGSYSHPDIQDWIDFATARSVQSLEFYWFVEPFHSRVFKLPNSIYLRNSQSIEHLALSNVDFSPSPPSMGFKGYASLKKLALFESKVSDEALEAIMSTCLLLESLDLRNCYGFVNLKLSGMALKELIFYGCFSKGERVLEIDAPNLAIFRIRSCQTVFRLKNSSCRLVEARLFDVRYKEDVDKANVRTLLDQIAGVEILGANFWLLQFVTQEHYQIGNRCATFKNLKEFYIIRAYFEEYNLFMFLALLEDCPLLNKLRIDFRHSCWTEIHKKLPSGDVKSPIYPPGTRYEENVPFIKMQDGEKVPEIGHLDQLKSIEFFYFSGFDCELEMVRRLLQMAVSLETLSLIFEDPELHVGVGMHQFQVPPRAREMLREKVSHFPRASRRAQILLG